MQPADTENYVIIVPKIKLINSSYNFNFKTSFNNHLNGYNLPLFFYYNEDVLNSFFETEEDFKECPRYSKFSAGLLMGEIGYTEEEVVLPKLIAEVRLPSCVKSRLEIAKSCTRCRIKLGLPAHFEQKSCKQCGIKK